MNEHERELLEQLAKRLAGRLSKRWKRIVVNWETEDDPDGDQVDDVYIFAIVRSFAGGLSKSQDFDIEAEVFDLVHELRGSMAVRSGGPWSTFDLEIDSDGTCEMKFDYEPARRLNGIRDEISVGRFENYLETYSE